MRLSEWSEHAPHPGSMTPKVMATIVPRPDLAGRQRGPVVLDRLGRRPGPALRGPGARLRRVSPRSMSASTSRRRARARRASSSAGTASHRRAVGRGRRRPPVGRLPGRERDPAGHRRGGRRHRRLRARSPRRDRRPVMSSSKRTRAAAHPSRPPDDPLLAVTDDRRDHHPRVGPRPSSSGATGSRTARRSTPSTTSRGRTRSS